MSSSTGHVHVHIVYAHSSELLYRDSASLVMYMYTQCMHTAVSYCIKTVLHWSCTYMYMTSDAHSSELIV